VNKKYVTHNGVKVIEGWPERIKEAQKYDKYIISDKEFIRIKYGDETDDESSNENPCSNCAVKKGQFHVFGCDIETCPS